MAIIWSTHGHNMFPKIEHEGIILFGIKDSSKKLCAISDIQKQRYHGISQNMALIWKKHGPNMVPISQLKDFFLIQGKVMPFQASKSQDIVEIVKTWS